MLYSIKSGNVPGVNPDQRRLIYLASTTESAYAAGLACVFTDGNAATAFTNFEDDPTELDRLVDWSLMSARLWFNTVDDPDRRRRRMAEFLVHESLPLELITAIGVHDRRVQTDVADLLANAGADLPVAIRRGWYF